MVGPDDSSLELGEVVGDFGYFLGKTAFGGTLVVRTNGTFTGITSYPIVAGANMLRRDDGYLFSIDSGRTNNYWGGAVKDWQFVGFDGRYREFSGVQLPQGWHDVTTTESTKNGLNRTGRFCSIDRCFDELLTHYSYDENGRYVSTDALQPLLIDGSEVYYRRYNHHIGELGEVDTTDLIIKDYETGEITEDAGQMLDWNFGRLEWFAGRIVQRNNDGSGLFDVNGELLVSGSERVLPGYADYIFADDHSITFFDGGEPIVYELGGPLLNSHKVYDGQLDQDLWILHVGNAFGGSTPRLFTFEHGVVRPSQTVGLGTLADHVVFTPIGLTTAGVLVDVAPDASSLERKVYTVLPDLTLHEGESGEPFVWKASPRTEPLPWNSNSDGSRAFKLVCDEIFGCEPASFMPSIGDTDFSGAFDSSDLVRWFAAGRYERDEQALFSEGDLNNDGKFNSSDIVFAMRSGAYEQ